MVFRQGVDCPHGADLAQVERLSLAKRRVRSARIRSGLEGGREERSATLPEDGLPLVALLDNQVVEDSSSPPLRKVERVGLDIGVGKSRGSSDGRSPTARLPSRSASPAMKVWVAQCPSSAAAFNRVQRCSLAARAPWRVIFVVMLGLVEENQSMDILARSG